jgi:hypothetical protein
VRHGPHGSGHGAAAGAAVWAGSLSCVAVTLLRTVPTYPYRDGESTFWWIEFSLRALWWIEFSLRALSWISRTRRDPIHCLPGP